MAGSLTDKLTKGVYTMTRKQIIREVYSNWKQHLTSMRFFIWIVRSAEAGYENERKGI